MLYVGVLKVEGALFAFGLASALIACSGSIGGGGAEDSSADESDSSSPSGELRGGSAPAVTSVLRKTNTADASPLARLTNRQYANTLRDLLRP